jgi:hypothetical protein
MLVCLHHSVTLGSRAKKVHGNGHVVHINQGVVQSKERIMHINEGVMQTNEAVVHTNG